MILLNNPASKLKIIIEKLLIISVRMLKGGVNKKYQISSEAENIFKKNAKTLMVCDYVGHSEQLTLDIVERFNKNDVVLVTSNSKVHKSLNCKFNYSLNLYNILYTYNFRKIFVYYKYLKEILKSYDNNDILFKLEVFVQLCTVIEAIDYYRMFFEKIDLSAVITTCDSHLNEYVLTASAMKYNVPAYTNQHGEITDLIDYIPVISDKIFVWGEKSKKRLIENGVPQEKVEISGNPKFDRLYSWYIPKKEEIYNNMREKYDLEKESPVITYLSPGLYSSADIDLTNAKELFKCFCQIKDLPINILVKLHPDQDDAEIFKNWIDELHLDKPIIILQNEELFDILSISDIAVNFHSTAGMEAIGFGIPTIIINILDGIDVKEYITFVEDSIECKTSVEFYNIIKKMIDDPIYYQMEIEKINNIRMEYFKNSIDINASEFIKNYMKGNVLGD